MNPSFLTARLHLFIVTAKKTLVLTPSKRDGDHDKHHKHREDGRQCHVDEEGAVDLCVEKALDGHKRRERTSCDL